MSNTTITKPDSELEALVEDDSPQIKSKNYCRGDRWVMTEKRTEALKRAQAKKAENAEMRRQERLVKEEEDRKILEAKVIKKAIALKKRQLVKEKVIEDISEEPRVLRPKSKVAESKYKYY